MRLPVDVAGSLTQWRFWLLPLAFVLLLAAIANPVVRLDRPRFDYLFVLDITQSMNVEDVSIDGETVSRLTLAREAVRRTMRRLPCGSRAGLGMFTEHRTLLLFAPVEVCENVGAFDNTLATLDWRVAWVSRSEVAKAIYSGMRSVEQMGEQIRMVFLTDGHEAPPVPPEFNVPLEQYAGKVDGVLVGVGGPVPMPIPILSDEGELLGYWRAEDVQQVDNYTLGRRGDVENEGADVDEMRRLIAAGTEHLSSLREEYLKTLAARARLDYLHVDAPATLARALRRTRYSEPFTVAVPLGAPLGALTLAALLIYLLMPLIAHLRRPTTA